MILLLFFMLTVTALHGSDQLICHNVFTQELIEEPKTIHDTLEIVRTALEDKPIYPQQEKSRIPYYDFIQSCLSNTAIISFSSFLNHKIFHQKNLRQKASHPKPLHQRVLLNNFRNSWKDKIYFTKLYYAIVYENIDDIFMELQRYNTDIDEETLKYISESIPSSKQTMTFYMNNYQKNFDVIKNVHTI